MLLRHSVDSAVPARFAAAALMAAASSHGCAPTLGEDLSTSGLVPEIALLEYAGLTPPALLIFVDTRAVTDPTRQVRDRRYPHS